MARKPTLSKKAQRFVDYYMVDLNATAAATKAGYSKRTAAAIGYELLTKSAIKSAVAKAMAARSARVGITQDRVLAELEALAFSDLNHYRMTDDGHLELAPNAPPDAIRAVGSLKRRTITRGQEVIREVEFRLWDKPGSLKLAGRHVGLFPDRVEHSGPGGGPIKLDAVRQLTDDDLKSRVTELLAKL